MKRLNSKKLNNLFIRVMAFVMCMTLFAGNSFIVNAEGEQERTDAYQTESLNNLTDTVASNTQNITSGSATGDIEIKLTAVGEIVKLYKIADVGEYNSGKFAEPQWVDAVKYWIEADANAPIYNKSTYLSPMALSSSVSSVWDDFYESLLYEDGNVISWDDADHKLLPIDQEPVIDGTGLVATFKNMPMGMYAVMAKIEGGKTFKPAIASLIPQVDGPNEGYYMKKVVTVTLKAAEATIDKTINGHDVDDVKVGEKVKFEILVTLPTLEDDRVTLTSNMSNSDYSLKLQDDMDLAFTFFDQQSNDNGEINKEDITVEVLSAGKEAKNLDVPVTYWAAADTTYDLSGKVEETDYVQLNADNYGTYLNDEDGFAKLSGGSGTYYAVKCNAPMFTMEGPVAAKDDKGADITRTVLRLNVAALKWYSKHDTSHVLLPDSIDNCQLKITYYATVSEKIRVNSEENYNKASIIYSDKEISDTVRAYTYALNVVKVDGSKEGTEDADKYLSNAHFKLYKETSTFIKTVSAGTASYVWKDDMDEAVVENPYKDYTYTDGLKDYTGYLAVKADFEKQRSGVSKYYIFEEEYTEDGETDLGVSVLAGQIVCRVFELVETGYTGKNTLYTGELVSVATAEGITLSGLDGGNYVLMETAAPAGYSTLAEDILFSINAYSYEDAMYEHQGSMAAFKDMAGQEILDGTIRLHVLNYKGLTLPSTGGKGILLFTMLGTIMMMSALIMLVLKHNSKDASYYM